MSNIYTGEPNKERGNFATIHGATFPIHFPAHFILNFSEDNMIVFEPFCGSGTTLIACENLGRVCYGMEIDPKYCDVIIKRFEEKTGIKPIKIV